MISFDTAPPNEPELRFANAIYIYTDYHFERHSHFYNELVLVQRGRLRSHIAGNKYLLGQGDLIVYPAHTEHEEWVEGGRPLLTWMCAFLWNSIDSNEIIFCHDTDGHMGELLAWLAGECHLHWPITGPSAKNKDRSFGLPMLRAYWLNLNG